MGSLHFANYLFFFTEAFIFSFFGIIILFPFYLNSFIDKWISLQIKSVKSSKFSM